MMLITLKATYRLTTWLSDSSAPCWSRAAFPSLPGLPARGRAGAAVALRCERAVRAPGVARTMRAGRGARPAYGRYVTALPYKALRVCGAGGGGAGDSQTRGGGGAAARLGSADAQTVWTDLGSQAPRREPWAAGRGRRRPPARQTKSLGVMVDSLVTFSPLGL